MTSASTVSAAKITAIVAIRLLLLPLAASLLLAWWLLGDVSEEAGEDVIFTLSFADEHATTLGLVGGANIGGGMVILFGPPVVVPLLVVAGLDVRSVARARR